MLEVRKFNKLGNILIGNMNEVSLHLHIMTENVFNVFIVA